MSSGMYIFLSSVVHRFVKCMPNSSVFYPSIWCFKDLVAGVSMCEASSFGSPLGMYLMIAAGCCKITQKTYSTKVEEKSVFNINFQRGVKSDHFVKNLMSV